MHCFYYLNIDPTLLPSAIDSKFFDMESPKKNAPNHLFCALT